MAEEFSAADWGLAEEAASLGIGNVYAGAPYAGAVNLPTSGGGGFADSLRAWVNPLLDTAKTVGQLVVMRDTLANQAQDRKLDRYARTVGLDLAKQRIGIDAQIAGTQGQIALAKSQRELTAAMGGGNGLIILLTVAGLVVAWLSYKKQK